MLSKIVSATALLLSLIFAVTAQAADDPNMHQVYAAAEAGQMAEAQRMMDKVLQDHPNSGKAHFVEAELLAKQSRMANANVELNKAEALTPGLPFAKPEAVAHLKQLIAGSQYQHAATYGVAPAQSSGIAWSGLLLGGGIIAVIIFGLRAMFARRAAAPHIPVGNSGYGTGPAPVGPIPQGGNGGGIGSSIVGGLATGAAVGAGMIAGEAIAHHFLDGDGTRRRDDSLLPPAGNDALANDDMGGADFGISDNSSWDDNSMSGGDDW